MKQYVLFSSIVVLIILLVWLNHMSENGLIFPKIAMGLAAIFITANFFMSMKKRQSGTLRVIIIDMVDPDNLAMLEYAYICAQRDGAKLAVCFVGRALNLTDTPFIFKDGMLKYKIGDVENIAVLPGIVIDSGESPPNNADSKLVHEFMMKKYIQVLKMDQNIGDNDCDFYDGGVALNRGLSSAVHGLEYYFFDRNGKVKDPAVYKKDIENLYGLNAVERREAQENYIRADMPNTQSIQPLDKLRAEMNAWKGNIEIYIGGPATTMKLLMESGVQNWRNKVSIIKMQGCTQDRESNLLKENFNIAVDFPAFEFAFINNTWKCPIVFYTTDFIKAHDYLFMYDMAGQKIVAPDKTLKIDTMPKSNVNGVVNNGEKTTNTGDNSPDKRTDNFRKLFGTNTQLTTFIPFWSSIKDGKLQPQFDLAIVLSDEELNARRQPVNISVIENSKIYGGKGIKVKEVTSSNIYIMKKMIS